jgi:lysophospholipase L1-like esterase
VAGTTTGAGSGGASTTDGTTVTTDVGTTGGTASEPLTIYLAGDSIVQTYNDTASTTDQAGWGQMFADYFNELVSVDNRAIGGRTARRFIEEGRLEEIANDLQAGDYLLVQFGTNDGNKNATYTLNGQTIPYYLDPATDFKTYLTQYIDLAREKSATPVLVTPTPRNSAYCTGGNGTGAHAEAMRELGAAEGVAVSDLNAKTVSYLMPICPAPTPEDFFFLRPDGSVDGTHFQENGARILASFVAEGIQDAQLPLAQYLK